MSYGSLFFISLLLTIATEIPILLVLSKYYLKSKIQTKNVIYLGVLTSSFSLPYLWFVFPLFISSQNYILIGEILVILIESVIIQRELKINYKNALILSVVANTVSYIIGKVVL